MSELVTLQSAAYIAQIVGVIGTLTVAFVGVRSYINSNKRGEEAKKKEQETRDRELETREAQLFMGLYQSLFSRDFVEAEFSLWNVKMKTFEDMEKLMKNKKEYIAWNTYATYYEGIGVLVREGLVDIRIVSLLISGMIIQFWEQYEDMAKDYRRMRKYDRFLIEVEYLYNRLMEYRSQQPDLNITTPIWPGDGISKEK